MYYKSVYGAIASIGFYKYYTLYKSEIALFISIVVGLTALLLNIIKIIKEFKKK